MLYVFFGIMALQMLFRIFCLIITAAGIVGVLFYIRPPRSWGKLLLYSTYTTKEKIARGILAAAVIVLMILNLRNGNLMGESVDIRLKLNGWLRMLTMLLLTINLSFPTRIFENGFRDYLKFESWEDVIFLKVFEDNRIEVGLKTPGIQGKGRFSAETGDKLPEVCREIGGG